MLLIIALATFLSTLLGGLIAIRLKDKLHLILGFSAGAVIGVAFFDLLPEALDIGGPFYSLSNIVALVALGFLIYLVLDRVILLHGHTHDQNGEHHQRGALGAGSLSIHSFLDGIGIGLAFQVSPSVGAVVAAAVLAHDFSDGINTVNFLLKAKSNNKLAFRWLLIDALAPVLGIVSTLFFSLSEKNLGVVLALFAGFFLYIGASDLIPESHHSHPKFLTTFMTVLGVGVMFAIIHFAAI